MANKPTYTTVAGNAVYSATGLNAIFDDLAEAIKGCLGRGGTDESPNSMQGELDMNLNRIRNLPVPLTAKDAANKQYVDGIVANLIPEGSGVISTSKISGQAVDWDAVNTNTIAAVCETFLELKGVDPFIDGDGIIVLGKTTRGDGDGGVFYWDSSNMSVSVAGDPSETIYVAPTSDATGASGAWVRSSLKTSDSVEVDIRLYGAVGDWNGSVGTDNLPFFEAAVDALPSTGGLIKFPSLESGENDYWISDTWNIRKSNVTLEIPRGVTIRSTTVTTFGQTISFAEGAAYGGSDSSRLENVAIVGGGIVRNSSPGTNENVIGFSRVKHYAVIGMNIPAANRKAITAQLGVAGGRILNNNIGTCGHAGISIETAEGTTADGYLQILGNHIESAGDVGIAVIGTNSPATDHFAVTIDNNVVESAATDGIYCFRVRGLTVGAGNEVWAAGERGINVDTCTDPRVMGGTVKAAGSEGLRMASSTGGAFIGPIAISDANTSGSTYSAINLNSNTAKVQMVCPYVGGSGFVYSIIASTDYELFGGSLATGTSGYFGTTVPSYHSVLLGGVPRTSRRIIPVALSGDSLSAANGVEYINLTQTAPTNVTDITGTRSGQQVTVLFLDGNSTMKDGTGNLRLAGDFTGSDQDTLTLLSNGTQLHEISRSVN